MQFRSGFVWIALLVVSPLWAQTHSTGQYDTDVPTLEQGTLIRYERYSPEEVVKQLEQIKRDGFNQIKTGIRIRGIQKKRDTMLALLDWCDANDMKFWILYPLQFGSDPELEKWLANPQSVMRHVNMFEELFKDRKCIAGIILGNEVNAGGGKSKINEQYPNTLADFQKYIIRKHGDLAALNVAWGTNFQSIEQIRLPEPNIDDIPVPSNVTKDIDIYKKRKWASTISRQSAAYLDVQRYMQMNFAKYYDYLIKKVFGPVFGDKVCYCSKISGATTAFVQRAVGQYTVCSWDHSMAKYPPYSFQLLVDTVQTAVGRPVYNSEEHLYHNKHNYKGTTHNLPYVLYCETLLGQMKHTSYNWGKQDSEVNMPKHKATTNAMKQIRQHLPVFEAFVEERAKATLGVMINEENVYWNLWPTYRPDRPELGDGPKAYAYVGALGKAWRYVLSTDLNSNRQGPLQTLIIAANWLTHEDLQQLLNMNANCQLVVVGNWPEKNEYGQSHPKVLIDQLKKRSQHAVSWSQLSQIIPPTEGLPTPYRQTTDQTWIKWSRWDSAYPFTMPGPLLEVRKTMIGDDLYIAVLNHNDEQAITTAIPWTQGRKVTRVIPDASDKPVNAKAYQFGSETVTVFKCQ